MREELWLDTDGESADVPASGGSVRAMSIGRHERVREPQFLIAMSWLLAEAAAVTAALTVDPRYLRLAVAVAVAAVIPHALVAARAPRASDLRVLRREISVLRAELSVRAAPVVEVVLVPTAGPSLGRATSINGNAYLDHTDGRRLVLDLVALEERVAPARV